MIGSIIGDVAGSSYEFSNIKTKDYKKYANVLILFIYK